MQLFITILRPQERLVKLKEVEHRGGSPELNNNRKSVSLHDSLCARRESHCELTSPKMFISEKVSVVGFLLLSQAQRC